jgi:hypothetical protein
MIISTNHRCSLATKATRHKITRQRGMVDSPAEACHLLIAGISQLRGVGPPVAMLRRMRTVAVHGIAANSKTVPTNTFLPDMYVRTSESVIIGDVREPPIIVWEGRYQIANTVAAHELTLICAKTMYSQASHFLIACSMN